MGDNSPEKKSGCGLLNAVFGRRWPRRTNSSSSLPGIKDNNNNFVKITQNTSTPKRRRNSSDDNTFLEAEAEAGVSEAPPKQLVSKSAPNNQPIKPPPPVNVYQQQHIVKKPPQAASVQEALPQKQQQQQHQLNSYNSQGYVNQGWRVPREATGISGELESMIADHQKSKGSNNLVRASSSNVMLFGNLGNLRQGGGNTGSTANTNTYEQFFETSLSSKQPNKYPNSVMGNVVKKQNDDSNHDRAVPAQDASLCRALSTRMDPETLKMMGNEDYKSGNFAEALALYDAAISIDPNKASYRSNKSAALTALGRLLEAVFECREAIRIEPRYHRAHHRLATLYLRLGEVEKAIYHYKHAGPEADQIDIAKCKTVQGHLNKCTDVKRMRDWNSLIKETAAAISAGADSAPSIYALQAEALLKVHRHQEADEAMKNGSKFSVDDCTKFFGPIGNANLLVVQAQVNLAVGRFDDALAVVQKAAKLDSNNKEVNPVMRRARAVAAARSNGNELFKASRFSEASVAYGEGLEHDPYNSVLLCNRAACRSKLGQYEKAVEDCNSALNVRPKYIKARLRRADCYAKLEKWEASIKDYEILLRESPEDEEVIKALQEAQAQLKKKHGGS